MTDIADEYVLVPAESSELISSLVCATSAVQYLLGCLARHDEERTQSMLGRIDDLWEPPRRSPKNETFAKYVAFTCAHR